MGKLLLALHHDKIEALHKEGASSTVIQRNLAEIGVHVTSDSIKQYCRTHIGARRKGWKPTK